MKKSIVLTLIVALLLAMTSSVFAATTPDRAVTVSLTGMPETVEKGAEVTVTVHFSEAVQTAFFALKYNTSVLEYVSSNAEQSTGNGVVNLGWLGTEKAEASVTFKVVGEEGAKVEGAVSFVNDQLVAKDNALLVPEAAPSVDVKVAGETTEEPDQPGKPAEKDEEESGKPGQYPKTGVNYVVAGGVLLSLISLVAVAKKM